MTNLHSILKSRDIPLPTKVHLVKAMVFPVVMYGCESWTIKKAESETEVKVKSLSCVRLFVTCGLQPTKLLRPWDSPGKNTGVGCHCLLQTRQTFVDKVMSLLFNMLSRLVIIFLPRSKCLLISWLQSPSAVILEPRKIKSATISTVSPSICH